MDFNFDGLPEPIVLPDEHFTLRQFERFQLFVRQREDVSEDPRYMREVIGAILEDSEFVTRTDAVPMSQPNIAEWNRLAQHLSLLVTGGKRGPLVKAPAKTRKRKRSASTRKPSAIS